MERHEFNLVLLATGRQVGMTLVGLPALDASSHLISPHLISSSLAHWQTNPSNSSMISVYKLPDSVGVHGRAGVCRSEFRAFAVLCCVCVLALVSSDTPHHVTSGPTRHSLRCKHEEFCRREKEAVRHQSHNGSSRGHNHEGGRLGPPCLGKNHTKRWHEHFTKVVDGIVSRIFRQRHDPRNGRNG